MSILLSITDLHVSVEATEILKGISLDVNGGELHAVMGPNGSGKSTLVHTLMGHPKYEVTKGKIEFRGKNLLAMDPHERAQAGLFLAFQYPKEIAGVTLRSFLFAAFIAQQKARHPEYKKMSPIKFKSLLEEKMKELKIDPNLAERPVNQGFSGGEKKKAEVLQLSILHPLLALLDETDSGLDVDALKIVADGINTIRKKPGPSPGFVLVTHYARILEHLTPDHVHVVVKGKIVQSGGAELAKKLEHEGYEQYSKSSKPSIALG